MKVLQINSVCGVGSTGRIATDLYNVLEEQGHECLIAYGRGTAPQGINSYKIGTSLDNYIHVAYTRLLDQHGYASKKATLDLVEKIKEYNPDIIHLHNIHGYFVNLEILFNYLTESNKKVVWTLHDCWTFTGHCSHFDFIGCEQWKTNCTKCPQKNEYPSSYLMDNSKKNFELKKRLFSNMQNLTIITPSEWLGKLVKASFLGKFEVEVINNGIDLTLFKPTKSYFKKQHNIRGKKIVLGVASVWGERKGLSTFVELSKRLDSEYKVVLVGVNEKQKKSLPENVMAISKTNNIQELVEIYNSATVFINPTLEDTFPTVNIESLACGTPVITFNTGGSIESINSSCGTVVEQNDLDELVRNIYLVEDKFIEDACLERSKQYDKQQCYLKYLDLYNKKIELL